MIFKSPDLTLLDYYIWSAILGHTKTDQHWQAEN